MRKLCVSLLIILIAIGLCNNAIAKTNGDDSEFYTNSETKYKVVIEDDADLLTDSEEQQLEKNMIKLTEYGNIAFKTINKNNYGSTASYAEKYYHEMFGKKSGTVFVIDMSKRMIYIFSDGQNYKTITKSKANTITDNVYKYAKNKDYYECANTAFSQMYSILEGGKIAEPMKHISNALLAVMIALFANFAIFKIATRNKAASVDDQIKQCEFSFSHTKPQVYRTGSHSEYSPISDSSSGGSSGGGGGGSSGGGGGHSF